MTEKIRPVQDPAVLPDGSLVVRSVATPESYDIRAAATIGSNKVIPVIFVPGIMGTNLKIRQGAAVPGDVGLKPGEAAWRPPNGMSDAFTECRKWSRRTHAQRQNILNAAYLEVDGGGELDVSSSGLAHDVMRERGWGEIYTGVYGTLLFELQSHLDRTFRVNPLKQREVRPYWKEVMECAPQRWGVRNIDHITEAELEKYAAYQYPLYAVGYNWLQSCAISADRLARRIKEIRQYWIDRKHECAKVILVTHSMGGLVGRAAARKVPNLIAGVIHGVMPALGAPVAYRRMASGTERTNPSNGVTDDVKSEVFAEIAGLTSEDTTPVMAASAGILQLLPNHLYPRPWLFLRTVSNVNKKDIYHDLVGLPQTDPYEFYRDTGSWYRLINPALVDPAGNYTDREGGANAIIGAAIDEAEHFHKEVLTKTEVKNGKKDKVPYYHDNTYAFYGVDNTHRTYSRICWVARETGAERIALTAGNVQHATPLGQGPDGGRQVEVEGRYKLRFQVEPQDSDGDDTVPPESGKGPEGHVKQVFSTAGYSHQGSFENKNMLLLTRHLIVKIVQGMT
jgi:pimeloyl-ACP methyl ester carboxylesterase